MIMQKKWKLKDIPEPSSIQQLGQQLNIDTCLSTILVQRGISTYDEAESYFVPTLSQTHSPFLMKNMEKAVERFNLALKNEEKIVIYGDYDVDGTTSVSLFINILRQFYHQFDYYIPDRFSEGYGLNIDAVRKLHQEGCTLLFTLDCGIRSVDEITEAKRLGIDVIICDHHEPGEVIPNGIVLNPKQIDCDYPFKDLCGCGVTFKFLQAVFNTNQWDTEILTRNTDLLTLAIGADIVSVTDENRIFCAIGLQQINQKQDAIIHLMFDISKKEYPVTLSDVVFTIAPRINAAGRMDHARKIVELFTATDLYEIQDRIAEIDAFNAERRSLDRQVTKEAIAMIEESTSKFSNVVYKADWSKGVLGIVASKLVELNHRPSIVLTKSGDSWSGSGRSIPQINLFQVLTSCEHLLEQFGGHSFACGLTIKDENLNAFITQFESQLEGLSSEVDTTPELEIDLEIDFDNIYQENDLKDVRKLPKFARILNRMEPFGPSNMRPVFLTRNVYMSEHTVLKDEHVKFSFQQRNFLHRLDGIAFNFINQFNTFDTSEPVDIVYSIGINYWKGVARLQLEIKDMRKSS